MLETAAAASVVSLFRYPVKGLSAEPLDRIDVTPGRTFPNDRVYAVEHGGPRFDPDAPAWLPKVAFLCLMKDAPLASLASRHDAATGELTLSDEGRPILRADLRSAAGREAVAAALAPYRGPGRDGALRVVEAAGHSFSDVPQKAVSIVNLASVRSLEAHSGRSIDPLRFRANLYIDGLPAWAERHWVASTVRIGDGVQMKIFKTTTRCAATEVEPGSGARDLDMIDLVEHVTDDNVCGVYGEVTAPGTLAPGQPIVVG